MRLRSPSNCSRLKYLLVPHGIFEFAAVASTAFNCFGVIAFVPWKERPETSTPVSSLQALRDRRKQRNTQAADVRPIRADVGTHKVCQSASRVSHLAARGSHFSDVLEAPELSR